MPTDYLGIWAAGYLTEDEWAEVCIAVQEFLSTHPKFHTIDFNVDHEEA